MRFVSVRDVLFHARSRDCFVRNVDAAVIVEELRRVAFDAGSPSSAAADAISDGLVSGEIGPSNVEEAAAVQAFLLRLATIRPDAEVFGTLHDALALDHGEL